MSDKLNLSMHILRNVVDRMMEQAIKDKSQLATNIVKWLDDLQDSADISGRKVDRKDYENWDSLIVYTAMRKKLWSEFGEGEGCYNDLMEQCKSRGYSQMYAYCGLGWIVQQTGELLDE